MLKKKLGDLVQRMQFRPSSQNFKRKLRYIWKIYLRFFNECVDKGTFPSTLKHANITSVFKKGYKSSKDSY